MKTNNWKLTTVNYNNISKEFAKSRKNMKWEEIDYFIENYLVENWKLTTDHWKLTTILDIGCGSGRLLEQFENHFDIKNLDYTGVDLSEGMIEEAKKNYREKDFAVLDMLELTSPLAPLLGGEGNKFDFIFFIASFHHLDSLEKREEVLKQAKKLLKKWGIIFMTNWSLKSKVHKEKYKNSEIQKSENEFWSSDFSIKFGDYDRYYHCFSLKELDYLFEKNGFEILENREFETEKNFVSVVRKY